jgi:hypothetical protein
VRSSLSIVPKDVSSMWAAPRRFEMLRRLRRFLGSVAESQALSAAMFLVVIASSVLAVINPPIDPIIPDGPYRTIDTVFFGIFVGEAILKILTLGDHPFSGGVNPGYFRRPWDVFDFIITIVTPFASCF